MINYSIRTKWDGDPIDDHVEPVNFKLSPGIDHGLHLEVSAPFFDDPTPPVGVGEPVWELWDYEVVEVFFQASESERNPKPHYLEIELGPHGHYLALLLSDCKQIVHKGLTLQYESKIDGNRWSGSVEIPFDYFPPRVCRMNAYAIHNSTVPLDKTSSDKNEGAGDDDALPPTKTRVYEALYPAPKGKYESPDFHRLEYLEAIDFESICPMNWSEEIPSDVWLPTYMPTKCRPRFQYQ